MVKKIKAVSAILVKKNSPRKFLLLRYQIHSQTHWDFVKGKIEKNEKLLSTLKREILEETGIKNFEVYPDFKKTMKYSYEETSGKKVEKQVTYFLVFVGGKQKIKIGSEHSESNWFSFKGALNKLEFDNQKEILNLTNSILKW